MVKSVQHNFGQGRQSCRPSTGVKAVRRAFRIASPPSVTGLAHSYLKLSAGWALNIVRR